MSDIFHEVDEDVRRENAAKLWKRYQTPVFVTAFLIVAATAGWSYYESNRVKTAEAANVRFQAAEALVSQGKREEAIAAFEALVKDAPRGYATLARLRAAAETAVTDKAKGQAAFDAIGEDSGVDKLSQEAARLRAGIAVAEQGDRQKMADRLGALITPNGPFRYTAQELVGLDALEDGDFDEAERVFDLLIADQDAPHAMRQRAAAYQSLLRAARGPKKPQSGAAGQAPAPQAPAPESAAAPPAPAPAPQAQ